MKLLIVESPGKIKKLESILGADWKVCASLGHVRDLPLKSLGINISNFTPEYQATERGKVTLEKIKFLLSKVNEVYLATDPDREGEAIAWHLQDALKLKNPKRVTFNSITKNEVLEGINKAHVIDMDLVKAQEARRVLDRLCGYLVSNPLSNIAGMRLTAGRVQSPALFLVLEREKSIKNFVSTTHYGVDFIFEADFKATWKTDNFLENEQHILDKNMAEKISNLTSFNVKEFIESENKQAPPAPFTTSSLQQVSSNKLKFSPKKTMEIAQKLYENGHITYMRTDSPNLSDEAISEIFRYCDNKNLARVEKARVFKSKENSQEAHEAIRASHIEIEDIKASEEEKNLYDLIRNRALASQLQDAIYKVRKVILQSEFEGKEIILEAQGKTLIFQGWKLLFEDSQDFEENDDEDNNIPKLEENSLQQVISATVQTKKTKPPAKYTQASLIHDLEKFGIGRPATYANIMENIISREYIKEVKQKLELSDKGEKLIDLMQGNFSFLDLGFTKNMEDKLDEIAQGKSSYFAIISENYKILETELHKFKQANSIPCPNCQNLNLAHKFKAKTYDFFACPDCENTFDNQDGKPIIKDKGEKTEFKCQKCQNILLKKPTKNGGVWFSCSNFPKCKERYWADENGNPKM